MIIKKFVAKTEEDAVELAKKELGNSVVVMNVKLVKATGPFAFLKSKQTEVTVALEEEREKFSTIAKENLIPTPKSVEEFKEESRIEEKIDHLQQFLESQMISAKHEELEKENNSDKNSDDVFDVNGKEENDLDKSSQDGEEENLAINKFMKLLYATMHENEVDDKYSESILEEIKKTHKPNMPFDYALANTYQKMILKFGKTEGILPAKKGPKIVVFVGPTGVGKTTTIAKLASKYSMEDKKKIALVTADTYRIAAAEQLRTYANILQVPFRIIYEKNEMVQIVKDFYDYDYIFLDTAGHSHQNTEQIGNMKEFITSVGELAESQVFLVLSATTKYSDLLKIADNYSLVANYELIFTKLDETTTFGNLLNIKIHTQSAIAYITFGQNVPEDLEIFNPQKTVKQLLGGRKQ